MSDMGEQEGGRARSLRIPPHPRPGANLVGFLDAESGLGEIARRVASALEGGGVPVAAISHRGTQRRQLHPHGLSLGDQAPFDTNLVCLNPGHLASFTADVGAEFFSKRYAIGLWFWETNRFRAGERGAARFFDELWVASSYVRDAIEPEVDIPVCVLPVPMEAPTAPFRTRAELGLPDGFTFLFVFDFWSEERKNPAAVIEAFTRAFAPGEGPTLVVKSIHGDAKARKLEKLVALAGGRSDVIVRDGYVSAAERDSYLAECDCYVSLHRSEGLGLTMAEAMALGKPVIATGYSGNLEFMSPDNSYLVPYKLVEVPSSWWAYTPSATWAEPDVGAAADLMRKAWEHPDETKAIGDRARNDVLQRYSPQRTAEFVERRLGDLRAKGAIAARGSSYDARPAIVDASQELAKNLGTSLVEDRGSLPTSVVRRLLRRALWPYFEGQQRVDTAVLDAVTSVHRTLQDLEQRVLQLEGSRAEDETDAPTRGSDSQ
jgi:glycosyltransferase involved in cell wall biosynthesis